MAGKAKRSAKSPSRGRGSGKGSATEFIEELIKERKGFIDSALARYFPKGLDDSKLEFICGAPSYEYDVGAVAGAIYQPGWDLLNRGGKRWRPLLMMLVIEALGKDPKDYADFLAIPEVVHNGTLIIDDIEDNSDLRRGKPCIHKIYGTDIAVNAGNSMYYIPLLPVIKNRGRLSPETALGVYEVYLQEMINISHGQAMDIWWHRGKKGDVSVSQYLQMCAFKTGTLARMSAKIGAILAGGSREAVDAFGRFAESIAVAFQIQDDILNLEEKLGKERGEDIKEGKRSLLVIRALSKLSNRDAKRLIQILDMHTGNKKFISEAIKLIQSTDAFEFARSLAESIVEKSWKTLAGQIPESKAKRELRMFADYLVARRR